MFQPSWGPASSPRSSLLPRSEPHDLIGKPFRKGAQGPWEGRGEALSEGALGSRRCQCRAGVTPWGGQLAFVSVSGRPGWAGAGRHRGAALGGAGWPGIYFKSRNQMAGQEGKPGVR